MENSDILISISNKAGDQISGKTFEYLSSGKPIIHFYYADGDMNAEIIRKYELGYCIKLDGKGCKGKDVIRFMESSFGKTVNMKNMNAELNRYTPQSVIHELFEERTQ